MTSITYDAVVAVGEPLTYHGDGADADNLISSFFEPEDGSDIRFRDF